MASFVRTRRTRRASSLLAALAFGTSMVTALACDGGDDTVYPSPLRPGGNGGEAGAVNGGAAGSRAAGNGGAAGSGSLGGAGLGGSAGATSAGTAGASGNAGTSGTAGNAGTNLGGAAGTGAGAAGKAGSASGTAGSSGASGTSGASGSSGASAGGSGGAPTNAYVSACASFESALDKCEGIADGQAKAAGDACRASEACAMLVYGNAAPGVLGCAQAACKVPTVVDEGIFGCIESNGTLTPEAKVAFKKLTQSLEDAGNTCAAKGDDASKMAIIRTAVRGFPLGARPELFASLASCTSEPCPQIAPCVASRVAATCNGASFFWEATGLSIESD